MTIAQRFEYCAYKWDSGEFPVSSFNNNEIKTLIERWRQGDESAAERIFTLYWDRLWLLAKSRINQRLGRREGPSDAVQSAFESFFRRTKDGQFQFDRSDSLWGLLAAITLNKVRGRAESHCAAKRDVAREVRADDLSPVVFARDPSAEEAVAFADELEHVVRSLSEAEATILGLCLQGIAPAEIAEMCSCSRWTVRRTLDRIGNKLRERLSAES